MQKLKELLFLLILTFQFLQANAQVNSYNITTKQVDANGLKFNCRIAGDPSASPIILLHGWPETSHLWEKLMQDLAREGYYCIAPDQRGYSPEARPSSKKSYLIKELAGDILSIADQLNIERFQLIGHDWGSAIGYQVCIEDKQRVIRYISMSVPHLQAFGEALNNNKEQQKMSKYMKVLLLPWLPENKLAAKNFKALKEIWNESTPEQITEYLKVLGSKKAIKASLNYYRANYKPMKKIAKKEGFPFCDVENLFLWGKKDIAISRGAAEANEHFINAEYQFLEIEAGHWLIQEAYESVKEAVVNFLKKD